MNKRYISNPTLEIKLEYLVFVKSLGVIQPNESEIVDHYF